MTLHQLRIFSAVARYLNLTKASKELHISQPSVSYQLRLLEEECKAKLYKKIGRGIALTEEGQLLLFDAEPIIVQVEKLKEKFSTNLIDRRTRSLTVGGTRNLSTSFLPTVLAVFKETHPHVQITLRTDSSPSVQRLVLNSEVEIAVVTNPSESPSLFYERCRREQLVIFASRKHPLAKREKLTLAQLSATPLVIKKGRASEASISEQILKQVQRQLNIIMHCETPEAVKAAVRTGIGLGVSYRDIVEPNLKGGDLKVLKAPDLKMSVNSFIIYQKERALSFPAQEFLTLLREWSQKSRWSRGSQRTGSFPSPSLLSRSPA